MINSDILNAADFIKKYKKFYFENTKNEYDAKEKKDLGLQNVRPVNKEAEDYIIDEKLKKGIYDKEVFAWKVGRIERYDDEKKEVKYNHKSFDKDDKSDNYITIRGKVKKADFEKFSINVNSIKNITWSIENSDKIDYEEDYEIIAGKNSNYYILKEKSTFLSGFGPVNIINAMFFVSKGIAPIYDMFAHKAIRALALDMNPCEIFMGANPDKRDVKSVMIMYKEYISLLRKRFPDYIGKDDMFIPRDLDRALWVYGHATKKYIINT